MTIYKTLITGNGFDIAHKLPTKYGDFIDCLNVVAKLTESDKAAKALSISNIFPENTEISKYYNVDNVNFDLSDLVDCMNNAWYSYFKKINDIQTWIDFESEIKNALETVENFVELCKSPEINFEKLQNGFWRISTDSYTKTPNKHFENCGGYDKIFDLKILKTITIDISRSRDYVRYVFNGNKYFKIIEKQANADEIVDFLLLELTNFQKAFEVYLNAVVHKLILNINSNLINKEYLSNYDIIFTFNYTDTAEKIYTPDIVSHLHGRALCNDEPNIVMGLNELESEILGVGALGFTKYYQKLFNATNSKFLDDEDFPFVNLMNPSVDDKIRDKYLFVIWGHSLDKSDEVYIKRLFDFVIDVIEKLNKTAEEFEEIDYHGLKPEIIVYYHDLSSKAKLLKNLLQIVGQARIEKLSYGGNLRFEPCPQIWNTSPTGA